VDLAVVVVVETTTAAAAVAAAIQVVVVEPIQPMGEEAVHTASAPAS
jgi:hypothetical protein